MGELSNLHHRISRELAAQDHTAAKRFRAGSEGTDDFEGIDPEERSAPAAERFAVLKPALAGAGLLCSAAVLGTGAEAGFELLSGGLALAGMAGAALLLADWYRSVRLTSPATASMPLNERFDDRKWE